MIQVSEEDFQQIIADAIDTLPDRFLAHVDNVAITWENEPSPQQRQKQELRPNETLFGLYEGIPLIKRGDGYSLVLPDKITIFRNPILYASNSIAEVRYQVKHTLWHEIAHHYGLDHDRIHELEQE